MAIKQQRSAAGDAATAALAASTPPFGGHGGAVLAGLAPLLQFLDAREVAQLVCSQKAVAREGGAALRFWLCQRVQTLLPHTDLRPRCSCSETLQPAALLVLLRRLHAISTFHFDLRFDAERRGNDVRIASEDCRASHWGPRGSSILGDRDCIPGAVSYWECENLSEGSYIGVTEVAAPGKAGFHYRGLAPEHVKHVLTLSTPACDQMPAIMYCEGGFITTGAFRGPKPKLPGGVNILDAGPFKAEDRVGVLVDLVEGRLVFVRNGEPQGMAIPLDCSKKYVPVFSAWVNYDLRLVADAQPPWSRLYSFQDLDSLRLDQQPDFSLLRSTSNAPGA